MFQAGRFSGEVSGIFWDIRQQRRVDDQRVKIRRFFWGEANASAGRREVRNFFPPVRQTKNQAWGSNRIPPYPQCTALAQFADVNEVLGRSTFKYLSHSAQRRNLCRLASGLNAGYMNTVKQFGNKDFGLQDAQKRESEQLAVIFARKIRPGPLNFSLLAAQRRANQVTVTSKGAISGSWKLKT